MTTFENDVLEGLSSNPKFLSSRYFYDEAGDKLFQKIMDLEEYYLTDAEYEILERHGETMVEKYLSEPFQLVELGAGDGLKTKLLFNRLFENKIKFSYLPVDISQHALDNLWKDLAEKYPGIDGHGLKDDYFNALKRINGVNQRKVVLFLGSNIGNYTPAQAEEFLLELRSNVSTGDKLLIGIDLKKDPDVVLKAYNDSEGVTRAFNLNLLTRINRELGGSFDLEHFEHVPEYDEASGAARSFLRSTEDQEVRITALDASFHFSEGESIATEISQKYSLDEVEMLADRTGFTLLENFTDSKGYFVDSIWEAKVK